MSETPPLSDFDKLWSFQDPPATETAFRGLLPAAEASAEPDLLPALLTQIARTEGLQRKFDEAHRTLDRAEALLPAASAVPRIRYLLERGRVWNTSGTPQKAVPLFTEAWDLARAAAEDHYAVDAAHMLAIVAPPGEANAWNLEALALAERSQQPRARKWLGALYNNMAWDHHDAGRFPEALELFQQALRWRETQPDPTALRIARWSVARTLRSLGRLDESLAIQRALLAELQLTAQTDPHVDEEIAELQKIQPTPALDNKNQDGYK